MDRMRRLAAALALSLTALLVTPWAAQAAGYQFWGYYHLVDGEWAFAVEGVGTTVPEDGSVQGLRFAVSSGEDIRPPRDVLDFDTVCGQVPADEGTKRVALVLDPGRAVDAPEGQTPPEPGAQCVQVPPEATMLEVVNHAVSQVRTDEDNMICGLAGFPASGCSAEVADPTPEQLAPDEPVEIPVVPVGQPVLTPPESRSEEPTEAPTTEPTEEDPTGQEPTESATADTTDPQDPSTETATETAPEETSTEETSTEDEAEDTAGPPVQTPDEADDEESAAGIPPWAWVVGILVLLGILAIVATAARNRRLDAVQQQGYDDRRGEQPGGPSVGTAPGRYPDGQYPDDQYPDDQYPDDPGRQYPDDPDGGYPEDPRGPYPGGPRPGGPDGR